MNWQFRVQKGFRLSTRKSVGHSDSGVYIHPLTFKIIFFSYKHRRGWRGDIFITQFLSNLMPFYLFPVTKFLMFTQQPAPPPPPPPPPPLLSPTPARGGAGEEETWVEYVL